MLRPISVFFSFSWNVARYYTNFFSFLLPVGAVLIVVTEKIPRDPSYFYSLFILKQEVFQRPQDVGTAFSSSRNVARYYVNFFNYFLPVGALMMIPVVGFCLSELGFVASYFILAVLHLLFCIVNAYDQPPIQLQVRKMSLHDERL